MMERYEAAKAKYMPVAQKCERAATTMIDAAAAIENLLEDLRDVEMDLIDLNEREEDHE